MVVQEQQQIAEIFNLDKARTNGCTLAVNTLQYREKKCHQSFKLCITLTSSFRNIVVN